MTDLSVIIVSWNVRELLATCLLSLRPAAAKLTTEVFVVDNASSDGSAEMVAAHFPEVTVIAAGENLGFAKANNLALKKAAGRHLMLLNPDTVLHEDALLRLVRYMDAHPRTGAAGPKLLNEDGSFQATAKRAVPTPWNSFCKLSGLSAMFPKSRRFNEYELGYLDPDERHEIGALCGAAMVVRREAYENVGGLDETYFMFGEDIAWSDAIRRAGFTVAYLPEAKVMHVKGQSMAKDMARRDHHFFEAMKIFYQQRRQPGPLKRLLVDSGVLLAKALARMRRRQKQWRQPLIDLLLLLALGWLLMPLLSAVDRLPAGLTAPGLILLPVLALAATGAYRYRADGRPVVSRTVFPLLAAGVFAFLAAGGYFLSGRSEAAGLFLLIWAGFGWILLAARRVLAHVRRLPRVTARSILAGPDDLSRAWLRREHPGGPPKSEWAWALWSLPRNGEPVETMGLQIIGQVADLPLLARRKRLRQVILSAEGGDYTRILETLEAAPLRGADRVRILDESWLWVPTAPG